MEEFRNSVEKFPKEVERIERELEIRLFLLLTDWLGRVDRPMLIKVDKGRN